MHALFALFVAMLLAGCATLGGNTVEVVAQDGSKKEVSIDPISFIGVQETFAISHGNFSAVLGNFPDAFFAEFHPLRLRYNALAIGAKTGNEYPAQALYAGFAECALRLVFIVEGNHDEPIIGVFVNTRFNRAFDLYGKEIPLKTPEKFISDAAYKKEAVLTFGTETTKLKEIPVAGKNGLQEVLSGWNMVRTKALPYTVRTPLAEKFVQSVARENNELNFSEKLVGNGRFGMNLSWFSTAMGAAIDVLVAANASDKGWDEKSELKRGYEGMIALVIKSQYEAALRSGMFCGPQKQPRVAY